MIAVWDKWAERHPATVLHLDECEVVQVKTLENEGYYSLQLGVGEAKPNRVNITTAGHYNKYGLKPKRHLGEFRVTPDALLPAGTKISAMHFVPGQVLNANALVLLSILTTCTKASRCMRDKQRKRVCRSYEKMEFQWRSCHSRQFCLSPCSWLHGMPSRSWPSIQE